jgi:hypothetical protein
MSELQQAADPGFLCSTQELGGQITGEERFVWVH